MTWGGGGGQQKANLRVLHFPSLIFFPPRVIFNFCCLDVIVVYINCIICLYVKIKFLFIF